MKTFMHAPTFWSLIWSSCELGILVPKGKLPLKEPNLYKRFKNQIWLLIRTCSFTITFSHFLYANIHKWSTSISKNCFTDFRPSSLIQTQSLKKQRRGKSKKQYWLVSCNPLPVPCTGNHQTLMWNSLRTETQLSTQLLIHMCDPRLIQGRWLFPAWVINYSQNHLCVDDWL